MNERPCLAESTRRRAAISAWRQRGFLAGKTGRGRLEDERVLELGGAKALIVYLEGIRIGERELRRIQEGAAA